MAKSSKSGATSSVGASGTSRSGGRAGLIDPRRRRMKAAAVLILWFSLTVLLLAPLPRRVAEREGETSVETVYAPVRIRLRDSEATAAEYEKVRQTHPLVFRQRHELLDPALGRIDRAFEALMSHKPTSGSDIEAIIEEIDQKSGIRFKKRDLEFIYKTVNKRLLADNLRSIATRMISARIMVGDKAFFNANRDSRRVRLVPETFSLRASNLEAMAWPEEARRHMHEIELRACYPAAEDAPLASAGADVLVQAIGAPNVIFDETATSGGRDALLVAAVKFRVYEPGDPIVRTGEEISRTQSEALHEVNVLRRTVYFFQFGGVILLVALCYIGMIFYMSRLRGTIPFSVPDVTMVCLPVIIAIGMGRFMTLLNLLPALQWALFPSALIGMLSVILSGARIAFMLVLLSAVLFGVATRQDLEFFVLAMFGGFMAVISIQTIRERWNVLVAGFRVGVANMLTIMTLSLFRIPASPELNELIGGLINGLFCAGLTWPILVIFERAFGIVTDIRLLEITGPQHPLIRLMEEKAPGSYQHVLNVTKLAESAAEAIGANYLLVRAGAYFHDVGKMLKPKYFSENQITLEDKKAHSKLSPYMSTLIIKNHVKEGIELAKKYGLPRKVVEFIPQHHGTSLIRYFYSEALRRYERSESTDAVREDDFRYPGPKPQSIESAIVMLADSVEAISTSVFTQPTVNENELRRVVTQAINDRFNDGQFDECDLTMSDLSQIRESFVKTLKARFHQRIAYPTMPKRESVSAGL